MILEIILLSYNFILPILLAFGCLFKSTFTSFFYLLFYIGILFIRPSVYRKRSKIFSWILLAFIALWSLLILLCELILGIIALSGHLSRTNTAVRYVQNIVGFYWDDVTPLQYTQMIIPDTLIFFTSIITLGLYFICPFVTPIIISSKKDKEKYLNLIKSQSFSSLSSLSDLDKKKKKIPSAIELTEQILVLDQTIVRYFNGYLQFILCLFAGILYPSIPNLLYLIGSMFTIIAVAFGFSIYWLELISWPLILIFTTLNIIYLFLSQFDYDGIDIAISWLSGTDSSGIWISGIYSWEKTTLLIAEFTILLLILYLSGYRVNSMLNIRAKRSLLRARIVKTQSYQNSDENNFNDDPGIKAEPEDFTKFARFIKILGWPLAFITYLLACIATPSIIQAVVLFIIMYGTSLLPSKIQRKTLPFILVYSTLFIIAQAIYNLDFNFKETDLLSNFGLIHYNNGYFGYIGIQCIALFILAIYWRYSTFIHKLEKKNKSSDNNKESSDKSSIFSYSLEISEDSDSSKQSNEDIPYHRALSIKLLEISDIIILNIKKILLLSLQILLKQSYYLTLIALLLCSLISINLFNFGYLIFFVAFLVSRKLALLFWIVLVLYTESVIMVIYLWQLTWTEHLDDTTTATWFGLQHYDSLITGLFVPILIFIFAIIQLGLIRVFKRELKKKGVKLRDKEVDASDFSAQDLHVGKHSRLFLNTCESIIDEGSLWICYATYFIVSMIGQYDLFSLYYLIIVYVCLLIHEFFNDPESKIRIFWGFTVFISGLILVSIYFFQFESIANYVIDIYPEKINQYLTLSDIGLSFGDSEKEIYLSLLGASAILFLGVLQFREFILKAKKSSSNSNRDGYEEIKDANDSSKDKEYDHVTDIPWLQDIFKFIKRFCILHAEKLTFIIAYTAVILSISFINDILLIIIIIGLILPNALNSIGLFVIIFCQLITIMLYINEFTGFINLLQKFIFANNEVLMEEWVNWLGVPIQSNLIQYSIIYNILIISLILERYANRWAKLPEYKKLRTSSNEKCPLFLITREELDDTQNIIKFDKNNPFFTKSNMKFFLNYILYYCSNFYSRDGIYIYTMALLVTLFIRYNIWSIIEIGLVALCILKPYLVLRLSFLLTGLFSFLLVFQYTTYLGTPPSFDNPPWYSALTEEQQSWFTLGPSYNINNTLADFFTLLLLSYLYKSYHIKKQQHGPSTISKNIEQDDKSSTISQDSNNNNNNSDDDIKSNSNSSLQKIEDIIDENDDIETQEKQIIYSIQSHHDPSSVDIENDNIYRVTSWRERIVYMLVRYSIHFIMLFMFMAATVQANILSCGYVIFSLFFLYKDTLLYKRKNEIWKWGRIYNFCVLIIVIVFQFPYFPACTPNCTTTCPECDAYAIQPIIGLYKFTDTSYVFSAQGILFDLIIFILMAIQAAIFDTLLFQRVTNHILEEKELAVYRAKLRYLQFLKQEQKAIVQIEQDKQIRQERLQKIHEYRSKKLYLIAKSNQEKLKKDAEEFDDNDITMKSLNSLKAEENPILGVPTKDDDKKQEIKEFEEGDFNPLVSESQVEEEISKIFESIGSFNDNDSDSDDNDISDDTVSLSSQDKKTYKDKLYELKDKIIEYSQKAYDSTYEHIVKYLYSQTFQHPDPEQSKYQICLRGIYYYCLNQSHILCYTAFILNNLVYANLLSLVYPTLAFAFAIFASPLPSRVFWRFCIIYTYFVIIIKFIFQISVFCICYSSVNWYFWCIEPFCSSDSYSFCSPIYQDDSVILRDLPDLFGIIKITEFFALGIGMDLIVLFTLLLHRNISKKNGLWVYLSDRNTLVFEKYIKLTEIKTEKKNKKKKRKKKKKEKIKEYKEKRKKEEKKQKLLEKKRKKEEKRNKEEQDNQLLSINLDKKDKSDDNSDNSDYNIIEDIDNIDIGDNIDLHDVVGGEGLTDNEQENSSDNEPIININEELEEEHEEEHEEEYEEDLNKDPNIIIEDSDNDTEFNMEYEYINDNDSDNDGSHDIEIETSSKISSTLKHIKLYTGFYYYTLFLHKATAKDYYVPMVTVEVLGFFYMFLFQNSFSYNPPDSYSFILLESRIPTSYFFILLLQFLFIVIDRVVYLYRSVRFKVCMQYLTLFYYTILLFAILPNGQGTQFDNNWVLIIFYFMKCIYWWVSALQICEGYPIDIQKRWITKTFNVIHRYIFEVYLLIPFLFELRSLLDWAVFDTTLSFFQWMKLEDIYRNLFQIRCKRVGEESRNWYDKQSFLKKNLLGFVCFIGLIALLWFPLFLLSSANPSNEPNIITSATFNIYVEGFTSFYENNQDQGINIPTNDQFQNIRRAFPSVQGGDQQNTQIIDMHIYSDELWVMTPPSKKNLYNTLLDSSRDLGIIFEYTFRRPLPPGSEILNGRYSLNLNQTQREQLADMVISSNQTEAIIIEEFIPRFYSLPISGSISTPDSSSNNLDIVLSLNRTIYQQEVNSKNNEQSEIEILLPYWYIINKNISQVYVDDGDSVEINPQLVILSAEVPAFFSSFAASGIIGLYITIVLVVGQFIRTGVSNLQYQIVFEDMPEPIDLITMCEDIFMAREDGDLHLERDLYNELIQLYRSPESLIAVTRRKVEPPPGHGTSI